MPPETDGQQFKDEEGQTKIRPSKAGALTPQQPSEPPGIPVFAQPNYEEQAVYDVREQTVVLDRVVISPDEDLAAVINMETAVADQAEGKSAAEVNVHKGKQAFLSNVNGMLEG